MAMQLNDIVAAQTIYVPSDQVFKQGQQYLGLTMGILPRFCSSAADQQAAEAKSDSSPQSTDDDRSQHYQRHDHG